MSDKMHYNALLCDYKATTKMVLREVETTKIIHESWVYLPEYCDEYLWCKQHEDHHVLSVRTWGEESRWITVITPEPQKVINGFMNVFTMPEVNVPEVDVTMTEREDMVSQWELISKMFQDVIYKPRTLEAVARVVCQPFLMTCEAPLITCDRKSKEFLIPHVGSMVYAPLLIAETLPRAMTLAFLGLLEITDPCPQGLTPEHIASRLMPCALMRRPLARRRSTRANRVKVRHHILSGIGTFLRGRSLALPPLRNAAIW